MIFGKSSKPMQAHGISTLLIHKLDISYNRKVVRRKVSVADIGQNSVLNKSEIWIGKNVVDSAIRENSFKCVPCGCWSVMAMF